MSPMRRDTRDDRVHWETRYAEEIRESAPSRWVTRQIAGLPAGSRCLDLACGAGRHAALLASAGHIVLALDFVEQAVRRAVSIAGAIGLVADASALPLRPRSLDCIVCVNFLDRTLFPALVALLRPGGRLIYETFTRENLAVPAERRRGPSNPAYLLGPSELIALVQPLTVVDSHEGLVSDAAGERYVAAVLAVNESRP